MSGSVGITDSCGDTRAVEAMAGTAVVGSVGWGSIQILAAKSSAFAGEGCLPVGAFMARATFGGGCSASRVVDRADFLNDDDSLVKDGAGLVSVVKLGWEGKVSFEAQGDMQGRDPRSAGAIEMCELGAPTSRGRCAWTSAWLVDLAVLIRSRRS